MTKLPTKYVILLVITIGLLFVDWRISVGIVVGYLFSLAHSKFLEFRFSNIVGGGVKLRVFFGMLGGLCILAAPMLLSMVFPQVIHFIGIFIGLVYQKYYLYVEAFRKKG